MGMVIITLSGERRKQQGNLSDKFLLRRIYKIINAKLLSHKKDYVRAYLAQTVIKFQKFMSPFFYPNNHINVCNLYSNFQKLLKNKSFLALL